MTTVIVITVIIIYMLLIASLAYGFDKIKPFELKDLKPKTRFSVVIPFRNEANHLPTLLNSLLNLNYPKDLFEVIFVDDQSNDHSVARLQEVLKTSEPKAKLRTQIIKNNRVSNAPKKDAITTAIAMANYEWIITTDADCLLPRYWLDAFDEYIQGHQPHCIAGPVAYRLNHAFLKQFQTLDFLSLQGATIGGFGLKLPFLCNGANFAYQKHAFKNVGGFNANSDIASGDDIFLLESFKQLNPKKVVYLKSNKAIVTTDPVDDMAQLIQQRLRWASKTSHNPNGFSKIIGIVVFLANLICITLPLLVLLGLVTVRILMALLVIKFAIDFLLLFKSARFFEQEKALSWYLHASVLYPFFSVYIAVLSLVKPYRWKGRVFKK